LIYNDAYLRKNEGCIRLRGLVFVLTNISEKIVMKSFVYIFMMIFLFGCAGNSTGVKTVTDEFNGAPDWVTKNCFAFATAKTGGCGICGIGSAPADSKPEDALKIAQLKAKADISKKLNSRIISVLTDYRAVTIKGGRAVELENTEEIIQEISSSVLKGVVMIDSWQSRTGALYVLMAINTDKFRSNFSGMSGIPDEERSALEKGLESIPE
jgi:hypothetical protein